MDRMSCVAIVLAMSRERHCRAGVGQGTTQTTAPTTKTDPKINEPFKKPDVKGFIKKFESDDREVFARRHEIVASLGLEARNGGGGRRRGHGIVHPIVRREGRHDRDESTPSTSPRGSSRTSRRKPKKHGQPRSSTVQGSQVSTNLPRESVDLVFLCDVYHHLENPEKTLASIRQALKPGGKLVVIDFDRVEGESDDFVLKHVRASKDVFRKGDRSGRLSARTVERRTGLQGELLPSIRKAASQTAERPPDRKEIERSAVTIKRR